MNFRHSVINRAAEKAALIIYTFGRMALRLPASGYGGWINSSFTRYILSNTGTVGVYNGQLVTLDADGSYTYSVPSSENVPYEGEVETTTASTQVTSLTLTGLYGAPLTDWPDAGNGYQWKTSGGSTYHGGVTTFVIPSVVVNSTGSQTIWNLERTSNSGTARIYFTTMKVDGSYPTDPITDHVAVSIITNTTSMNFAPQKYEGFTGDYVIRNGNTQYFNGSNVSVGGSGDIYVYYKRNEHQINYISEGSHVSEREEHVSEPIFYEADISGYGQDENGNWYYEPDNGVEGYFFAGWYADSACQIPFDFNTTMPNSDITVYAKWDTYRVRVVLVPTPNNEHNDEVEFANNQALSFRLDYNEQVDDTNNNSSVAHRPGYKLIGWYYSPDFDPSTEIHFPLVVNKDTPGVDMNYQAGEDWDKYGDNDGSHDNVRGILKLYAKWELDVDESSVYVKYDVDDVYRTYDTAGMLQTTIPVDDNKYALTNNNVTFQVAEAPTEYTPGFEFYRWVLLNPDGSESTIMYNPADTASEVPSSFIYEETITDDLGNTATIKKIRLKAKFNIETEKVTTVTFDGNGGVTNDSAEQESVTESYPINKDFFMKDEDSFVREGYTLIGWAFEREDGSKITAEAFEQAIANMTADQLIQAGIYQLGQKVAADNLEVSDENNWEPLENTVYAVWEINTYTVTVKKIVDGETTDKTFEFTASASEGFTLSPTSFSLEHNGTQEYLEIPYGTVLTFTETPASGYSIKSVEAKQITNPDKTEADIDLNGEDGEPYTIKGDTVITYTNEKAKEQKLRIYKIDDSDTPIPLNDVEFTLDENSFITGSGENENGYTDIITLAVNDEAYILTETTPKAHYTGLVDGVPVTVSASGVTVPTEGQEGYNANVSVSDQDGDGVYTITVVNPRERYTVTVVKNVTGTDADKDAQYSFTATGLTETVETFQLYGSQLPETLTEGQIPTHENTKIYENIPYGTVFSIEEAGTYTDFDTTIVISNEAIPVTTTRRATGDVTVDGDITITYTNTRNKQPVKVFKFETGTSPEKPLEGAEFSLTGPEETGISYTNLTTNDDGYLVNEDDIIFELPVNNGAYTLTETQAPAGYLIIGDGTTTFTVTATGVTGAIPEMEMIDEAEVPTGVYIIKVQNSAGIVLPSIGGPGTNMIYLIGIMLTDIGGAGLVVRKRRRDAA